MAGSGASSCPRCSRPARTAPNTTFEALCGLRVGGQPKTTLCIRSPAT
jgi:hypothetical protein